eukprot:751670-Hanusia_phi.AAC.2
MMFWLVSTTKKIGISVISKHLQAFVLLLLLLLLDLAQTSVVPSSVLSPQTGLGGGSCLKSPVLLMTTVQPGSLDRFGGLYH